MTMVVDDNGYPRQWLSMAIVAVCLGERLLTDGLSEDVSQKMSDNVRVNFQCYKTV